MMEMTTKMMIHFNQVQERYQYTQLAQEDKVISQLFLKMVLADNLEILLQQLPKELVQHSMIFDYFNSFL